MKRLIFAVCLILLNFLVFNYLTNHFVSKFTYDKMILTYLVSFIAISVICFFISSCKYILKLYVEKSLISFKSIYFDLYLNVSIAIYIVLILTTIVAFL